MLIEFEVGNFLSFRDPVRLSMLAANPIKEFLKDNTFQAGRYRLLKSAVVYGANASGKSNLLDAMAFVRWFVIYSSKGMQVEEEIPIRPFKLDSATENAPSHFEVCFMQNDFRYRYGFEADKKAVRKEWLFRTEKVKENILFLREGDAIDVSNDFNEGKGLEEKTRDNALFLSVVAQFNGEIAGSVLKWFLGFRALHGLRDQQYERFTAHLLQDNAIRPLLVEFIRRADVGIEDLIVSDEPVDEAVTTGESEDLQRKMSRVPRLRIATVHQKFNDGLKAGFTNLDFSTEESEGTKKFFRITGPLLDGLMKGYVVCIDELDAKLHPSLTKAAVRLFNSADSNPKNAQLIFATHDTNLLQHGNLRRDQIWFTEKTQQSATDLYSLAEIKLPEGAKVRKDAALEKNYIQGRYGAIPFLGNLAELLKRGSRWDVPSN
ncbi:MAG: ATP-binding protein [Deltaproteobacteria bacterium]|nr:ATP-binding protein [Deltaproteobacteria bacterium]